MLGVPSTTTDEKHLRSPRFFKSFFGGRRRHFRPKNPSAVNSKTFLSLRFEIPFDIRNVKHQLNESSRAHHLVFRPLEYKEKHLPSLPRLVDESRHSISGYRSSKKIGERIPIGENHKQTRNLINFPSVETLLNVFPLTRELTIKSFQWCGKKQLTVT